MGIPQASTRLSRSMVETLDMEMGLALVLDMAEDMVLVLVLDMVLVLVMVLILEMVDQKLVINYHEYQNLI